MTEQTANKVTLPKNIRRQVWWRRQNVQASWNYERMHNLGFLYTMAPVIKYLYQSKEDRRDAIKRHLEFVNTHPYLYGPINGLVMSFEEERASGAPIDDKTINGVKVGMMGPLAGVGDPIFWGTLRPVIGAFAASLALSGSWLGPILFILLWNVIRLTFTWYTQEWGYQAGTEITRDLSGGIIQKISTGASILGMFVMGVLVPRWTSMNFPIEISRIENSPESMVDFGSVVDASNNGALTIDSLREMFNQIASGQNINAFTVQTLQDILDQLLPGLMPLLLTMACIYLLRKDVKPTTLIFGIFGLGIVLYALGIMG